MVVVSTKEFRDKQKKYFDLAKNEKVVIKRSKNYVNLVVTEELDDNYISENWAREFFAIPDEYRCNPFEWSPSGDLFFADKRNVKSLEESIARAEQDKREGRVTVCKTYEDTVKFLESL